MEFSRIALFTRQLLAALLISSTLASAQDSSGSDASSDSNRGKEPANLRIWAMLIGEKAPITIRAKSPGAESPHVLLQSLVNGPLKGNYIELSKGSTEITLLSGDVPVKTEKIQLVANDYRTLLVTRRAGSLDMVVLQDPLPGQTDFPPSVRLFNYGSERTAEIRLGAQAPVSLAPNTYLIVPLTTKGTVKVLVTLPNPAGGPPATSITEVSTAKNPSWSIVTIPDYRGYLRPRVSPDGPE